MTKRMFMKDGVAARSRPISGDETSSVLMSKDGALTGAPTLNGAAIATAAVPGDLILSPTTTPPAGYTYTTAMVQRLVGWYAVATGGLSSRRNAGYCTYNGRIYVIMGTTGGAVTTIANYYNPLDLVQTAIAGTPGGSQVQWCAAESDGAGLLFCCGGTNLADNTPVNTLLVYDVGAGTWSQPAGSVMPGVRAKHCIAKSGAFMYVFGGIEATPALVAATWRLSLGGGTWQVLANMTTPRIGARCAAVNGNIYVIGGNTTVATVAVTGVNERYNVAGNSWTTMAPMPIPMTEGTILVKGNLIWYIGGQIQTVAGTLKQSANTFIYDTLSDAWSYGPQLTTERAFHQAGLVGDRAVVLQGFDSAGSLTQTAQVGVFPGIPSYVMVKT